MSTTLLTELTVERAWRHALAARIAHHLEHLDELSDQACAEAISEADADLIEAQLVEAECRLDDDLAELLACS